MANIPTRYDPEVESKLYKFWEENGFFQPESPGRNRKPFCIVIPPPNITGSLHMGHALNNTIQDCLTRWKRMQRYSALWMPGVDHAGIATQNVVEKELVQEGKTRSGLGREEFVNRIWQWKKQYGDDIVQQLRLLGSSCDWKRLRFTMDEGYSAAVREEFVRLYEEGLIYRGNRIINWCPSCLTALSDIEVEHEEVEGKLYYIKYPLKEKGEITVATTRPETMLGDVAVAVHPDDDRYKRLVGKSAILPLVGREMKIIADEKVDPSFGTGAVKITPAHDPDDFEIGHRHKLSRVTVIAQDGKMTEDTGKYSGQDRYACRENILKDLKNEGRLSKIEKHTHSVGHCYRCNTVVEPLVSLQWFVKMKELAEPAIKAVEEGKIRFIPKRWTGVYLNWMRNINDWCISRQIWWGHRIPVWYCRDCESVIVARAAPSKCEKCDSSKLEQDEDVLDTWFSSALWPFAGLGWPKQTEDLKYFYPTSVLVTGYEIIYFWVARMIMTGLKFMGEIPFSDVYIHGIVRDAKGRKMSKSLGNVIDPRKIIKSYGTDALRMTLMTALGGQDIYLGDERLEGMRNFTNKLWNAGRFIMMNVEGPGTGLHRENLRFEDRWILTELQKLIRMVTRSLCNYRFAEAGQILYEFTWHKFCDWYVEHAKVRLADSKEKGTATSVLLFVWETLLRLLHPFMPFITEELWQLLPPQCKDGNTVSIMVTSWPEASEELIDEEAATLVERRHGVVQTGRELRAEHGVPTGEQRSFTIGARDEQDKEVLKEEFSGIDLLLGAREISVDINVKIPGTGFTGISGDGIFTHMDATEADMQAEKERLKKQLEAIEAGIQQCEKKLSNTQFVEKAPDDIVEKEKSKKRELEERRDKILSHLGRLD